MVIYRTIAASIDLIIAFFLSICLSKIIDNVLDFELFIEIGSFFYLLLTSLFLSIKRNTFGEKIVKIKVSQIKGKKIHLIVPIIGNLIFILFINVLLSNYDSLFHFSLVLLLFIVGYGVIFIKNNFGYPMTMFDFIFKTYYIKYTRQSDNL